MFFQLPSSRSCFRLMVFLMLFFSQDKKLYAQHYSDEDYLQKRAVTFSNGNLPFYANAKWGLLNKKDSVIVQPVYDDLFASGTNRCIAKLGKDYFLLDQHFRKTCDTVFSSAYWRWYYFHGEDKTGKHYWGRQLADHSFKMFSDSFAMVRYNVYPSPVPFYNIELSDSPKIDSLILYRYPTDTSYFTVYYKDRTEWIITTPDGGNSDPAGYVFVIHRTGNNQVINLNTRKVFDVDTRYNYMRIFRHEGQPFLQFSERNPAISSLITDDSGKVFYEAKDAAYYNGGYLIIRTEKDGPKYSVKTFPELETVAENVFRASEVNGSVIAIRKKEKGKTYYYNDTGLFYSSSSKGADYAPYPVLVKGHPEIYIISRKRKNLDGQYKTVSSKVMDHSGKILFKTRKSLQPPNYYDTLLHPSFVLRGKEWYNQQTLIYQPEENKLLNIGRYGIAYIADNRFVKVTGWGDSSSIIDAKGNKLIDSTFENVRQVYDEHGKTVFLNAMLNEHFLVYDTNLNIVCTDCGAQEVACDRCSSVGLEHIYIVESYRRYNEEDEEPEPNEMRLVDRNFQSVYPHNVRAAVERSEGKYIVILKPDKTIEYIRLKARQRTEGQ